MFLPFFVMMTDDNRTFINALFIQYHDYVCKIIRDHIPIGNVEDVCQEVFLELCDKAEMLRRKDEDAVKAYIITTAQNEAFSFLRRLKKRAETSLEELKETPGDEHVESGIISKVSVEMIKDAMRQLSEDDRELIKMQSFLHKSDAEVAEKLDIGVNSVRVYRQRARKRLEDLIEEAYNRE